jgi:hypothetical protein
VENSGRFFHALETKSLDFPRIGKKVSTRWKTGLFRLGRRVLGQDGVAAAAGAFSCSP